MLEGESYQAKTANEWIYSDLVEKCGYPNGELTNELVEWFVDRDIKPTLDYLPYKANIYSAKPLLIFDLAKIKSMNKLDAKT